MDDGYKPEFLFKLFRSDKPLHAHNGREYMNVLEIPDLTGDPIRYGLSDNDLKYLESTLQKYISENIPKTKW